jgi:hypothetical protein
MSAVVVVVVCVDRCIGLIISLDSVVLLCEEAALLKAIRERLRDLFERKYFFLF